MCSVFPNSRAMTVCKMLAEVRNIVCYTPPCEEIHLLSAARRLAPGALSVRSAGSCNLTAWYTDIFNLQQHCYADCTLSGHYIASLALAFAQTKYIVMLGTALRIKKLGVRPVPWYVGSLPVLNATSI